MYPSQMGSASATILYNMPFTIHDAGESDGDIQENDIIC